MITFGSDLDSKLANTSTEANWILKLFFNDDTVSTNFIGVSGRDRVIGTTTYHALVISWGGYTQSADLLNLSASQGAVQITLDNKKDGILAGRFSDLFATKNFVGRKWELYMESGGSVSTETLGQGIITSDIDHDDLKCTILLLHDEFDLSIPVSVVDNTSAPKANIGAAIPYAYGETRPTNIDTTVNLDRLTVAGMFPAIIDNRGTIQALPDVKALGELNVRWVAMKDGDNYAFCLPANVTVDATSDPAITITGTDFRIPLKLGPVSDTSARSTNRANAVDEDLTTDAIFRSLANGNLAVYDITVPPLSGEGVIIDVYISTEINAETSPAASTAKISYSFDNVAQAFDGSSSELLAVQTLTDDVLGIGSGNKEYPTARARLRLSVTGNIPGVAESSMTTEEITAELRIAPKDTFVQSTGYTTYVAPGKKARDISIEIDNKSYGGGSKLSPQTNPSSRKIEFTTRATPDKTIRKYWKINAPANLEYIYYAGRGRVAGSWIQDGRSNGYSTGNNLFQPIYQAESLIRDEAGFTNVDKVAFDESGNTTNGFVGDVFDMSVVNIRTAFAQKQFTSLFEELNILGSQCGTFFFVSGNGNIKCKTRRRKADYAALSSGDLTVEFGHITPAKSFMTSINDVRNSITTKYKPDYSNDQLTEVTTEASDATSQGTSVDGYGQTLILEDAAPAILQEATAEGLNTYTLDSRKDQKRVIPFTSMRPTYQRLEIGDTINFVDWPEDYKVQGKAVLSTDIWMVNSPNKFGPDKSKFQVMEVS